MKTAAMITDDHESPSDEKFASLSPSLRTWPSSRRMPSNCSDFEDNTAVPYEGTCADDDKNDKVELVELPCSAQQGTC